MLGVPRILSSADKIGIKRNIKKDLKRAKLNGGGYDSFDEEWIVDQIRTEDKVYYGSDTDISAVDSEVTHSDTDSDVPLANRRRRYRISQNRAFFDSENENFGNAMDLGQNDYNSYDSD